MICSATPCNDGAMSELDLETPGTRLRWARQRLEISVPDFAKAMGLKPVSYRAYENDQNGYAKHAHRFAEALGITPSWLLEGGTVTEQPIVNPVVSNAEPFKLEGATNVEVRDDVPVYGTAIGAPRDFEGEAIEQVTLSTGEVLTWLKRPPVLNDMADIYGIFVTGSSMEPRYEEGDPLFVDGKRPPMIGDDVIVYLREPDGDGERDVAVLVKRLVRRSASYYELEQYNPRVTFRVAVERISKVHRVLSKREIFA